MEEVLSTENAVPGTSHALNSGELASFGAVHLRNTSLKKATEFWTRIVGMRLRHSTNETAEFGTEDKTLVVVSQTATFPYQQGYSGLYHFAVHAPNRQEFARMLYRLLANNYPCAPVDHTMSRAVYLKDPDGITVEFTLETPERFKKIKTEHGLRVEDADGTIRAASESLDVDAVLKYLPDRDLSRQMSEETRIGHLHLYAYDLEKLDAFYKQLGFVEFNYLPEYKYADLGAGGAFQHRIALNSWHGVNKPLAPGENAGMEYFNIEFASKAKMLEAVKNLGGGGETGDSFRVSDPTGNLIVMTHR
ncbi:VOC family protein [Persicitalea jodogahamensis]|uniref:Glyoxalase n=1 Tax=Persicitalea jodogahamensis TaxID=402147 RepID=A0A8J3D650_9BACT|nr:VOC family protein [Persicitalea jodogahamensis]GHB80177.1 glyoxalase [Persicitalea jodogahamensis]